MAIKTRIGAQRYNNSLDKIFAQAEENAKRNGRTSTWQDVDMRSEAIKKQMASKMKSYSNIFDKQMGSPINKLNKLIKQTFIR